MALLAVFVLLNVLSGWAGLLWSFSDSAGSISVRQIEQVLGMVGTVCRIHDVGILR